MNDFYVFFIMIIFLIYFIFRKFIVKDDENESVKNFIIKSSHMIWIKIAFDYTILDVNDIFIKYTGYEKENLLENFSFLELLEDNEKDIFKKFYMKLITNNQDSININILTNNDECLNANLNAKVFKNKQNSMYCILVCNITCLEYRYNFLTDKKHSHKKNKKSNHNLRKIEQDHKFLINAVNVGVMGYNFEEQNFYFSDKCRELFGIEQECPNNLVLNTIIKKMHKEDYYKIIKSVYICVKNRIKSFKHNFRIYDEDNNVVWIEFNGKFCYKGGKDLIQIAGSFIDITSSWIYQEKINNYTYFDSLTGLSNKVSMQGFVNFILKVPTTKNASFIIINIDDFRLINNYFGYDFGDNIICQVVDKIKNVSPNYKIGRFNGDEIGIFLYNFKNINEVEEYIKLLTKTLSIEYNDASIFYKISTSIGTSLYPQHGKDFEQLHRKAVIAMNNAKEDGKNNYKFFTELMNKMLSDKICIENDLRKAVSNNNEIKIFLQPQYNIKTGDLFGFEVLTRWYSSSKGLISPEIFIPLAEKTKLIVPLGKWIIEQSCKILEELKNKGYGHIKISVNLSPVQLVDNSLVDFINKIVSSGDFSPKQLELEITETAFMEKLDLNVKKINKLKKMGISIALDDFGTGYSSLTYLKILPISSIKIDKSFISDIGISDTDKEIIKKIIELSHILNLKTIVEGVETIEQLDFVKSIGCDVIQGYLGGRPVSSEDMFGILDKKIF